MEMITLSVHISKVSAKSFFFFSKLKVHTIFKNFIQVINHFTTGKIVPMLDKCYGITGLYKNGMGLTLGTLEQYLAGI